MEEGTMTEELRKYRTYASEEEALIERFEKLAKRAKKLGVEPPRFEVVNRYEAEYTPLVGKKFPVAAIEYIIHEAKVALEGGWQFIGVIERGAEANIVLGLKEHAELFKQFQKVDLVCEHCQLKRQRAKTLIVRNEVGEVKQIGVDCVRDFLGHEPPRLWEFFAEDEYPDTDFREMESDFRTLHSAWEYVLTAFRIAEVRGFTATRDADGMLLQNSTKDLVQDALRSREELAKYPLGDEVYQKAEAAFDWIVKLETDDTFLQSLKQIVLTGFPKPKYIGILVSIVKAHPRFLQGEEVAKKQVEEQAKLTQVVEGKQEIVGVVLTQYWKDTDYGMRQVMVVLDDRGFKVWGTVPASIDPKEGYRVKFNAGVAAGNEFGFGFFSRPTKAVILDEPKVAL
jgi:hypothetical protein